MTFHELRDTPALVKAVADLVFRIRVLPSRTMISIGTSFGVSAPEWRSPTTSLIVRP
jgi:hypothetical protein